MEPAGSTKVVNALRQHAQQLPEIIEAREALETKLAALAAERRTEQDLAAIDDALEVMERDIQAGGRGVEGDELFHAAVTAAGHSRLLAKLMVEISDLIRETRIESLSQPERPINSLHGPPQGRRCDPGGRRRRGRAGHAGPHRDGQRRRTAEGVRHGFGLFRRPGGAARTGIVPTSERSIAMSAGNRAHCSDVGGLTRRSTSAFRHRSGTVRGAPQGSIPVHGDIVSSVTALAAGYPVSSVGVAECRRERPRADSFRARLYLGVCREHSGLAVVRHQSADCWP